MVESFNLCASLPLPDSSPSLWRVMAGFSWSLHSRHTLGGQIIITVFLFRDRHSHSSNVIHLSSQMPNALCSPVENLRTAPVPADHPYQVTIHLPQHVRSHKVSFPAIVPPPNKRQAMVRISIQIEAIPSVDSRDNMDSRIPYFKPASSRTTSSSPPRIAWLDTEENDEAEYFPFEKCTSTSVNTYDKDQFIRKRARKRLNTENQDASKNVQTPFVLPALLYGSGVPGVDENIPTMPLGNHVDSFSDFHLIAYSGKEKHVFKLHRCVLALASPVFRAMFKSDMKEKATACMEIVSFSEDCIITALKHIYGVQIIFNLELSSEVYRFAHQYEISSLVDAARQALIDGINDSTCLLILQFAAIYDDTVLRHFAVTFISSHFSELVADENMRQAFNLLSLEVFCNLMKSDNIQATELEILLTCLRWIAQNGSERPDELLECIQWNIMEPKMINAVLSDKLCSLAPSLPDMVQGVLHDTLINEDDGESPKRSQKIRRYLQQPNASLWLPLVSSPKLVVVGEHQVDEIIQRRRLKGRYNPTYYQGKHVETSFEHAHLKWNFRSEMKICQADGCPTPRISASLWLEEDDTGSIWSSDDDGNPLGNILPLRVAARFMIWDANGGHLQVRPFEVVFHSAGWTSGWTIQDLLGGHEKTTEFIKAVRKESRDVQAVQVAVVIETCKSL